MGINDRVINARNYLKKTKAEDDNDEVDSRGHRCLGE
jgi:hypothetical protein